MEIREKIFELFTAVDGNIRQPEHCQFIQASPLVKGTWKYKEVPVKTITFYFTTSKIMIQGSGTQTVLHCKKENYLSKSAEIIREICYPVTPKSTEPTELLEYVASQGHVTEQLHEELTELGLLL